MPRTFPESDSRTFHRGNNNINENFLYPAYLSITARREQGIRIKEKISNSPSQPEWSGGHDKSCRFSFARPLQKQTRVINYQRLPRVRVSETPIPAFDFFGITMKLNVVSRRFISPQLYVVARASYHVLPLRFVSVVLRLRSLGTKLWYLLQDLVY